MDAGPAWPATEPAVASSFASMSQLRDIKLSDICTVPPVWVSETESLSDVLALMRRRRISSVIVARDGRPLGIFTERDALALLAAGVADPSRAVAAYMTPSPVTGDARTAFLDGYMRVVRNVSGYARDELVGRDGIGIGAWVEPEVRAGYLADIAAGRPVRALRARLRRKDGVVVEALINGDLLHLRGEPCGLSVITDITCRSATRPTSSTSGSCWRPTSVACRTWWTPWATGSGS